MKALIVETSRLYQEELSATFNQLGIEVFIAENLAMARSLVSEESFNILTCCHNLDDGDGVEFLASCRNDKRHSGSLLLFLLPEEYSLPSSVTSVADQVLFKKSPEQLAQQISLLADSYLDAAFTAGKVLLIEDEKAMAMLLKSQLTKAGYHVEHYPAAEEAWQAFENQEAYGSKVDAYDLVMTDINLAGEMSGEDLINHIRAMDDARGVVPIIAITGDNSDKLRIELYRKGVNDYLIKPVLPQELQIRASNLVTAKRLLDQVHDTRRELFLMATTDKLTGCQNRHSLTEFSGKFIAQAIRHNYPVSMMVIDLDHFKSINDNHGHATGDRVLAETGQMLRAAHRDGDLVARFGGEEFVTLLSHCDRDDAVMKAERTRSQLEELKPAGLTVTASIGVTTLDPQNPRDFEILFNAADKGVYQAKENGRNRVVYQGTDQ